MEVVLGLMLAGGAIYAYVAWQQKVARERAVAQAAGRALYLRHGGFPATCSWCKDTSVAHRLMVFERVDESWHPYDFRRNLAAVPDHAVEPLVSAMFYAPNPSWRRFCTEKCAREFLASEHVTAVDAFGPCAYCGSRFPLALVHCPNCAATRQGR